MRPSKQLKYSREQVEQALVGASSIKDFIVNLGLKPNSGTYRYAKKYCLHYGLELPVFDTGTQSLVAIKRNTISNEEWFVNGQLRQGQPSKRRLLNMGWLDICSIDGQTPEWNGKLLTLQLDHINGDRFDNRIENLRIVCPNCHTQTETYGNSGSSKADKYSYCVCGARKTKRSVRCGSCAADNRIGSTVVPWPEVEILCQMVKDSNFTQAAKQCGATDNAVRKHLRRNGVNLEELTRRVD